MIQDRTSVFPKAFTELTFGLSNVLKVALCVCVCVCVCVEICFDVVVDEMNLDI